MDKGGGDNNSDIMKSYEKHKPFVSPDAIMFFDLRMLHLKLFWHISHH